MAETTLISLQQSLSENMGDYESFDSSADGDSQGFTVVASALLNLVGGTDTDAFEGQYIEINDSGATAANGEVRRIDTYIADLDTPTLRMQSAFSEQIKSGITVILHRFNPVDKKNTIRQSILESYPDLYLPIRDETLVVDDLLANSGFETFSSGFTGWTEVGSPTVTKETTIVMHGDASAKIVASGSAVGQLTQAPTINIDELTNDEVESKRWVYATEPNTARLRLDFGNSNFSNSVYHSGRDQWELLELDAAVPSAAIQVKQICEVAISGTAYFDHGWMAVGRIYEYTLPTSIITGPHRVTQQADEDDVDGPYYQIPDNWKPTTGRILRVEGYGVLSRPTTNTGTTEVGEPQVRLIVAYAEMLMWRLMASPARSARQDRQGYVDAGRDAAGKVAVLKAQQGMKTPRMGAQRHRGSWHLETNSSGKTLVFPRERAGTSVA
jgi:hypothetical protein